MSAPATSKSLGMLQLPEEWANNIREAFNAPLNLDLKAPVKVSLQTLANGDMVIHNYNNDEVSASLNLDSGEYVDKISQENIALNDGIAVLKLPARTRMWITRK